MKNYRSFFFRLSLTLLLFKGVAFSQQEEPQDEFMRFFIPFTESEEQEKDLSFSLQKSLITLDKTPMTIEVLGSEDLETLPVRNVSEALGTLSSVSIHQNGEFIQPAVASVFGADVTHTKILLEGIELNSQLDGTADISSFPVSMIRQVEISNTPLSSLWGSGLAGAVYLKSKDPQQENSLTIDTSLGSSDTFSASAETSIVKGAGKFLFIPHYTQSGGYRDFGQSERTDYFFKTLYDFSDSVQIQFLCGYDKGLIEGYEQVRFYRRSERDVELFYSGLKLIHEKFMSIDNLMFTFFINGMNLDGESRLYRLNNSSPFPYNENDSEEQRLGERGQLSFDGEKHDFSFEVNRDDSRFESENFKGKKEVESHYFSLLYGYEWFEHLALQTAVRYDENEAFSGETSFGGGFTFKDIAGFDFNYYASRDFNAPPLSYVYMDNEALMMKSNLDLNAETGKSHRITLSRGFLDTIQVKLSGYQQKLEDGIVLARDTDGFYQYRNVSALERKGMEMNLEWDFSKDSILKISANYNDVENRETGEDVPSIGRMKYTGALERRFTDKFTVVLTGYYIWWDMAPEYNAEERNFIFNSKMTYELKEDLSLYGAIFNLFNEDLYWIDVFPNPERNYQAGIRKRF